jgi:hypothetical protein
MNNLKLGNNSVLEIKIAQTGDILRISLNEKNLGKKFDEIYTSILKELKLKRKLVYLCSNDGKMVGNFNLNIPLEEIIKKFGLKLILYYEKVL